MPRYFSEELKDLVSSLLRPNPAERLSIREVRRHPWTRGRFDKRGGKKGSRPLRSPLDIASDGKPTPLSTSSSSSSSSRATSRRNQAQHHPYKKSESSGSLPLLQHRVHVKAHETDASSSRRRRKRTASTVSGQHYPTDDTASCISDTDETMTATTAQHSDDDEEHLRFLTEGEGDWDSPCTTTADTHRLTRVQSEFVHL
jgi:serine/threonine protein kinase